MKKELKVLLGITFLFLSFSFLFGETYTIGNGTTEQSVAPFCGRYDYSLSKALYSASDLRESGIDGSKSFMSLGYNLSGVNSAYTRSQQYIYMRNTSRAPYDTENTDDTEFTLVFSGNITFSSNGWQHIAFQNYFVYDGTSNLEILWEDHDGSKTPSTYPYFISRELSNRTLYKRENGVYPDAGSNWVTFARLPNIQLTVSSPPAPALLISPLNSKWVFDDSIDLHWTVVEGNPSSYDIHFGTDPEPPFIFNQSSTSYTVTDLIPGERYYWQIVPRNDAGAAENCPIWSFSLPAAERLAESFESEVFPPPGWSYDGLCTRSTLYNSYGSASVNIPVANRRLITPLLSIEYGDSLYFDLLGTISGASIDLEYSTDGQNWSSLKQNIKIPSAYTWKTFAYELTRPADHYYLAFRPTVASSYYLDSIVGPKLAPPGPPVLLSPDQLADEQALAPIFSWEAPVTGGIAESYKLYLDTTDGSTLFAESISSPYTLEIPLSYDTTYYWKLTAINAGGESEPSEVRSFTTLPYPFQPDTAVAVAENSQISISSQRGTFFGAYILSEGTLTPFPNPDFSSSAHEIWRLVGSGEATIQVVTDEIWFAYLQDGQWVVMEGPAGNENPHSFTYDLDAKDATLEFAFGSNANPTLPVELSQFNAFYQKTKNEVQLSWRTESESQMLGYRLYRNAEKELGSAISINPSLIAATNSSSTALYGYLDRELQNGTYFYWLEAAGYQDSRFFGPISVLVDSEPASLPINNSSLYPAYPNPFHYSTTISYELKTAAEVRLDIYNLKGQLVRSFVQKRSEPGLHHFVFEAKDEWGNDLANGIYMYRLQSGGQVQMGKMLLLD